VILALDTNVLVGLIRGKQRIIRDRLFQALLDERELVTSLIVFHELMLGCERHHNPAAERERVKEVLSQVRVEALDEADAISAAKVRAALGRRGLPVGSLDALIAGQALARNWTVVTANQREFTRIEGLNVIDWTAEPD
jgi:tRNA(fMet)-specific endonuclease VapC